MVMINSDVTMCEVSVFFLCCYAFQINGSTICVLASYWYKKTTQTNSGILFI